MNKPCIPNTEYNMELGRVIEQVQRAIDLCQKVLDSAHTPPPEDSEFWTHMSNFVEKEVLANFQVSDVIGHDQFSSLVARVEALESKGGLAPISGIRRMCINEVSEFLQSGSDLRLALDSGRLRPTSVMTVLRFAVEQAK